MREAQDRIYLPPYSEVRLVECRDHFQLVPVPKVKTLFGYGRIKARQAVLDPDDPESESLWSDLGPDEEVWAVMQWYEFEDDHREKGNISFIRPEMEEEFVRKEMEAMQRFDSLPREKLLAYSRWFKASEEDLDYIDRKCPNYQSEPDPNSTDEYDVYHARLKVMSELQPKTVALLKIAASTKDPQEREFVERQAVQSCFAELAPGVLQHADGPAAFQKHF